MKGKIDPANVQKAIENVEKAIRYEETLRVRREEQRFKQVEGYCSLYDALMRLTKDDLNTIRKNYGLKNLSSLNKAELAKSLAGLIPRMIPPVLETMDQAVYALLQAVVIASGSSANLDISADWVDFFQGCGILFPGKSAGKKVGFMPVELVELMPATNMEKLQGLLERNTEWIRLANGLLYYYGVLELATLLGNISRLTGKPVNHWELINVLGFAAKCYGRIQYTENGSLYGYKDARLVDSHKLVTEQNLRSEIPYYPFTKGQLLRAGRADYFDRTPEMVRFLNFLGTYYEITTKAANETAMEIIGMIQNDAAMNEMLQFLQSRIELPTFEFIQEMYEILMDLHNSTRQWALKGHSPNELYQEERQRLQTLPLMPFAPVPPKGSAIRESTRSRVAKGGPPKPAASPGEKSPAAEAAIGPKTGRNDLCPCGSGKKYKKCCGK